MQAKNHIALALAVPIGAAIIFGPAALPDTSGEWVALIIGSLAPDIDGVGMIARPSVWFWFLPPSLKKLIDRLGVTFSRRVRATFGHRKIFHWPLWGLLLISLALFLRVDWVTWFGRGYIYHIFGDSLTRAGVPLLAPISQRNISFAPMVTGGKMEKEIGKVLWIFVASALLFVILRY